MKTQTLTKITTGHGKRFFNLVFISNILIFIIFLGGFFLGQILDKELLIFTPARWVLIYLIFLGALSGLALSLRDSSRWVNNTLVYQVLLIGCIFMILPFFWMIITSFKTYREAMSFPPIWWPEKFQWKNWREAWNAPKANTYGDPPIPLTFTRYFFVSVCVGLATTAGILFTSALAAYAFAKMRFWGKSLFFYIILAMMMIPGQVLLIPNYLTLAKFNWLDRYHALIIPWLANVFTIFLMRQFFMTIPDELWDAAQIDGAGRFRFLWQVIIPLSKPVLITAGIFDFLGSWNSLFWPLIVVTRPEMRTLMVGLQAFNQDAGSDYHLLMAASTFAVLPVVIMFFFLQRFFIQGIARTGLKS
jgi:multiple sugar transport system permease protein